MNKNVLCLLILSLYMFNFSAIYPDCIDDRTNRFNLEEFVNYLSDTKYNLAVLPQKITKTIQGITFTSDYDNGSIMDITDGGTNIFNCTLYTDVGVLGTYKYWFRFKISGAAGKTITLNIDHTQNLRPFLSFDGINFRRMTSTEAPSSGKIIITSAESQNFAEIAFFAPLGYEETYNKVSDIVRKCDDATTESIGKTFQGRDMWMVTVTDKLYPDSMKHRVWIHSRAHSAEVTSTHVLIGILEQATENTDIGKRLRRYCIFNIVPLLNIDGVYLGNTRWDSQGMDCERAWCEPVSLTEAVNIKNQVDKFMAGLNPIEVALNLHSTQGNYTDTFFFKHIQPSVTAKFEQIQQNYIDAFNNASSLFNNLSPQKSLLSACIFIESYFWNNWAESVMAMTHEGHFQKRITDGDWITDSDYRQIGKDMTAACIEYFNIPDLSSFSSWLLY